VEVIAVNISPDMGERIVISGLRDSILEVFPEIGEEKGLMTPNSCILFVFK
jgi:hypothetical protein